METPISSILQAHPNPAKVSESRDALTREWRETKLKELGVIGLVVCDLQSLTFCLDIHTWQASISSAAITGCFSLSNFTDADWYVHGLFFGGLFTSIITLVTVLQQTTTLNRLGADEKGLIRLRKVLSSQGTKNGNHPAPSMLQIYVWQAPILLLNITLVMFLLGLALLVLPVFHKSFSGSEEAKVGKLFGPIALFALLNYLVPAILLVYAVEDSENQPPLVLPPPVPVGGAAQQPPAPQHVP